MAFFVSRQFNMASSPGITALTKHEVCYTIASIHNVIPHSNIRDLSSQGVSKLEQLIERNGFASSSYCRVIELDVANRTPLVEIAQAYNRDQQTPADTTISPHGISGVLTITEDPSLMNTRRYGMIDGSHRLAALQRLHQKAVEAGDEELAERYAKVPVIVLHGLTEQAICCLASRLNTGNTNDYVRTTMLNTYTAVRTQLDLWTEGDGKLALEAAVTQAKSKQKKKAAQAHLNAHLKGELNINAFCQWQTKILQEYQQTLEDVYNCGIRNFQLIAYVAAAISPEEAKYYQSLYDEEVSSRSTSI